MLVGTGLEVFVGWGVSWLWVGGLDIGFGALVVFCGCLDVLFLGGGWVSGFVVGWCKIGFCFVG